MNAILDWLHQNVTVFGLAAPAWAFIAIAVGVVTEWALGRFAPTRCASLIALVATLLRWVFTITRIGSIPVVGTAIVRFLETVAGIDLDGDGKVGDGAAKVAMLAVFGLALSVSGCATVQPIVKDVQTCAGPDCADIATKILPAAEVVLECELEAGGAMLPACAENGLAALAAAAGPDGWKIVACVVNAIEKDATKPPAVRQRARAAMPVVAMHRALNR